ncbi:MAG: zinc ribbon domain-containing protein [Anaerolineales bacterium]|nr:zinc ribbon domain-containing protein [Anaerolineales bacterium]
MKKLRNETERAKFEAARALRLQREQGKLGQLQNQRKDHVSALGEAVWELYQAGQVTDARLVSICTQIRATQQEIVTQEQGIEAIKQEQPPEPPSCPQCGREVSSSDAFCPGCGVAIALSATPLPAINNTSTQSCPQCRKPVRVGAAFCPACGARLTA